MAQRGAARVWGTLASATFACVQAPARSTEACRCHLEPNQTSQRHSGVGYGALEGRSKSWKEPVGREASAVRCVHAGAQLQRLAVLVAARTRRRWRVLTCKPCGCQEEAADSSWRTLLRARAHAALAPFPLQHAASGGRTCSAADTTGLRDVDGTVGVRRAQSAERSEWLTSTQCSRCRSLQRAWTGKPRLRTAFGSKPSPACLVWEFAVKRHTHTNRKLD